MVGVLAPLQLAHLAISAFWIDEQDAGQMLLMVRLEDTKAAPDAQRHPEITMPGAEKGRVEVAMWPTDDQRELSEAARLGT
jgi:hypothetical protein